MTTKIETTIFTNSYIYSQLKQNDYGTKKEFHEECRGTGRLATGQSIDRHRDDVHLGSIGRIA
jgi:hypothetical protein